MNMKTLNTETLREKQDEILENLVNEFFSKEEEEHSDIQDKFLQNAKDFAEYVETEEELQEFQNIHRSWIFDADIDEVMRRK